MCNNYLNTKIIIMLIVCYTTLIVIFNNSDVCINVEHTKEVFAPTVALAIFYVPIFKAQSLN
jgi:hypothetical protein